MLNLLSLPTISNSTSRGKEKEEEEEDSENCCRYLSGGVVVLVVKGGGFRRTSGARIVEFVSRLIELTSHNSSLT